MARIIATALLVSLFAIGSAMAQGTCATGTSSIKKCCEDSAVSKDGKPLSGAAKTSYVKKCQADAS